MERTTIRRELENGDQKEAVEVSQESDREDLDELNKKALVLVTEFNQEPPELTFVAARRVVAHNLRNSMELFKVEMDRAAAIIDDHLPAMPTQTRDHVATLLVKELLVDVDGGVS